MLDQSHNITDPIESFILSIEEIQKAFIKSMLINHEDLFNSQIDNDVIIPLIDSPFCSEYSPYGICTDYPLLI